MRGKKTRRLGGTAGYRCDGIRQDAVTAQLTVQAKRGQLAAAPMQAESGPYEGLAGRRTDRTHDHGAIRYLLQLGPRDQRPMSTSLEGTQGVTI